MPNFTKKTLLFGIVVPDGISEKKEAQNLVKTYKRNYVLSSVGLSILIHILAFKTQNLNILYYGIFLLLMSMGLNYIFVHNKAKALKIQKGWTVNKKQMVVVDTSQQYNKNYLSDKWFWIPIGISVFTIFMTMIQYPHLPDVISTRFDLRGEPIGYSEKGFLNVFGVPFTQVGMIGMFYFIHRVIQRAKPNIQASRPKSSLHQNQIAKRYWAIYLLVTLVVMVVQFCYMQLNIIKIVAHSLITYYFIHGIAIGVPLFGAIFVSSITGQSGSRIKVADEEEPNSSVIDRDDDKYWKLGMFYFNSDDPTLFIEKRFGIGWTINYGRPLSIVFILIIILLLFVYFPLSLALK